VLNNAGAAANIEYGSDSLTINTLTGSKPFVISGFLAISGDCSLDSPVTLVNGGNLAGPGNITLATGLTWLGGIMSGTGSTILKSGSSSSLTPLNLSRLLVNHSSNTTLIGGISMPPGAGLTNETDGTLTVNVATSDAGMGGEGVINNKGILNK